MARTKASVGSKVSSGKSSKARCCAAPPPSASVPSGSTERGPRNNSGGNPVCPRETPKWQKPITTFFIGKEPSRGDDNGEAAQPEQDEKPATSSRSKRNIIMSDDEDMAEPANTAELDVSIQLEPLTGEECHKIEEYYPKNGVKGKGVGKKTKDKENVDNNIVVNTRSSLKRDLEESDEEVENANKKMKVAQL